MSLAIILGSTIIAFLFIYLAFKLEQEDHSILQVILVAFAFILIFLAGKATFDANTQCDTLLANQTVVNGTTTYSYTSLCTETENSTASWIYRTVTFFVSLFGIYLLVYFIYNFYKYMRTKEGKI